MARPLAFALLAACGIAVSACTPQIAASYTGHVTPPATFAPTTSTPTPTMTTSVSPTPTVTVTPTPTVTVTVPRSAARRRSRR
ncbi:MAG TPA: hypothetical protein VME19_12520 [Streptosporangiaceae bacterium]|nr:hypothetical protein [Streptosporangiaceae bacterium]